MKKLYFLLLTLLITSVSFGQATGDIAFIAFNADGDDDFAVVALADIPASTTIYFSDDELNGSGGFADSNEGNIQWDTPASIISAGTVVVFTDTDAGTNANFGTTHGTITYVGSGTINLSSGGDALFAYLGTDQDSPTTFLAGIQNEAGNQGDLTGSGLTEGTTFVNFFNTTDNANPDGGFYSAPRNNQATFADYLNVIGLNSSWTRDNFDGEAILPIDATPFTLGTPTPSITITSPSDMAILPSGTTSADISITVLNFAVDQTPGNGGMGDGHIHWTIDSGSGPIAQPMKYDVLDETIPVTDGGTYTVFMQLVDNSHQPFDPVISSTVTFSVPFPCDLQLGEITSTCVTETAGVDLYDVTIAYTGGGTSQYTLDSEMTGTIGGDDPSSVAAGTITISGITEDTDFVFSATGDPSNSSCNITRNIFSPTCVAVTCANAGDIIITEILQNPSNVGDNSGEYFEVYNTTGMDIDMVGWQVFDITNLSETFTIGSSLVVPGNGYAVLGNNADMGTNGGVSVDYEYPSNFYLGNGSDELRIECSSTIIDEVSWDGGTNWPDPNGIAMELSIESLNATDNDDGANWGIASTEITPGGDLGTPGSANDFSLSISSFESANFSMYPNPTSTGFVTITSSNNEAIQAQVFDVLGKQVISNTISNNKLDVSSLNTGIYIVKLTQNNATITKKLVIK